MSAPGAAGLAEQLLLGQPQAIPAANVGDVINLLKAEADRLISVDCARALEIADLICRVGGDDGSCALGLLTRGDALRELGRYAESAHAYQEAAHLFNAAGDEVGWARTRIGATLTARYTGSHAQILADLDAARRILHDRGLWLRLTRLEQNVGHLLSELGRAEDALAAHERALRAAEHLVPRNELLEAEVWGNLSLAYYRLDDHDRAELFHKQAIAVFEREGQREFVARAHRNYARYAVARGHYSAALSAVVPGRRELLRMGRIDGAAHLGQVGVDCLLRLNRPTEAAELAERVAAEFEASGAQVEAAATWVQQALALARMGDANASLAALARAETLFGTVDWEAGPCTVKLGRAVVLGELGRWPEALNEAAGVRDELHRRAAVARTASAELVRARALRALGQPTEARSAVAHSLDLLAGRSAPALSYDGWRLLAELARDAGDTTTALDAYLTSIAYLEQLQGRILTEYRGSFLSDKADVYQPAVGLLLDAGELDRAFELIERAKSRALVDALAGGLDIRVRPRTTEQEQLARQLTRLRAEHDARVDRGDPTAAVADLERDIEASLEELRLAGADDLERLSLLSRRVTWPRESLDEHTALVQYFFVSEELVILVADRRELTVRRVPAVRVRLQRELGRLQLNLQAAAASGVRSAVLESNARRLMQRLYEYLLAPVIDRVSGHERLLILPHSLLHQVPFAALYDGAQWAAQRWEIVLAPSASSLSFCLRPRARPRAERALVVAHSADGALPGALAEARSIATLFGGEPLLEADATTASVRTQAAEADVVHIATHGVARPDAPLFSYLRLADGHLTALDCFELHLDCALVTLSACESGSGHVDAGDEQIGLPRAFLYAGARSVLYTLWRVDDRTTQGLIERFYRELRAGRGRGAALRTAQLDTMRQVGSHPWLWAALQLVGDWR